MSPVLAAAIHGSRVDFLVFLASAVIVLAGALGVVVSKHPIYSALSLVMTLFGVAILFVEQDAHFLAAVQVIVYAGAIVVLFLFVIMLLGVDRHDLEARDLKAQRPLAFALGAIALAEMLLLSRGTHWVTGTTVTDPSDPRALNGVGPNVEKLADAIFTKYLLAFEITSVLLVIAVVGAVVLARKRTQVVGMDEETITP